MQSFFESFILISVYGNEVEIIYFKGRVHYAFLLPSFQCFNQININPRSVAEFSEIVKRNREGDIPSIFFTPSPPLPDLSVLNDLKEVCS